MDGVRKVRHDAELGLESLFRLPNGLCETLGSLCFTILFKVIKIVKLVTRDALRVFRAIADDLYLVVEGHDSNFALLSTLRHVTHLGVDGRLDALYA